MGQVSPEGTWTAEKRVQTALCELVGNVALQQLTNEFGYVPNPDVDPLDDLHAFAQRYDYRQGAERGTTNWPVYSDREVALVDDLGPKLPFVSAEAAEQRQYDMGVIFGCGGKIARARVIKMLEQHQSGVNCDIIAMLGSARPVGRQEQLWAGITEPKAVCTEFDLMNMLFEEVWQQELMTSTAETFEVRSSAPVGAAKGWRVRHYELADHTPVFSLSSEFAGVASNGRSRSRADTRDTLTFLRQLAADCLNEKTQVLGVTSSPSALYQYMMTLDELTLPTGAAVEMIGHPLQLKPPEFMQEVVKAGLDHAIRVRDSLKAGGELKI